MHYFVAECKELYGLIFTTYNVHSLIYLHEDVEHFGTDFG